MLKKSTVRCLFQQNSTKCGNAGSTQLQKHQLEIMYTKLISMKTNDVCGYLVTTSRDVGTIQKLGVTSMQGHLHKQRRAKKGKFIYKFVNSGGTYLLCPLPGSYIHGYDPVARITSSPA